MDDVEVTWDIPPGWDITPEMEESIQRHLREKPEIICTWAKRTPWENGGDEGA